MPCRIGKTSSSSRFWILRSCGLLTLAVAAVMMAGPALPSAHAAEPQPWLCRDKPAISSPGRAHLMVARHDRREWELFLMRYNPQGGKNGGFRVVRSYRLAGSRRQASGSLGRGQFFAVALYHRPDGYWICPGEVDDNTRAGEIANICYSVHPRGECDVSLFISHTTH